MLAVISLIVAMCSCSPSWHLRRAMKKDPSIFQDTARSVQSLKLQAATLETPELNHCFDRNIEWVLPREYEYKGEKINDSIIVKCVPARVSGSNASLEVECDPVIITEQLPPIILEPTFWQKAKYGVIAVLFVAVLFYGFKLFRG